MKAAKSNSKKKIQINNFSISEIFHAMLSKWYLFIISIAITVGYSLYNTARIEPTYTRNTVILIKATQKGTSLEELIGKLREAKEEKELRFRILCDDFRPEGEKVVELFEKEAENHIGWTACNDNHEGIRINADSSCGNGWFLIRLSVHDPIIVLNTESDDEGGTLRMCKDILKVISSVENIDKLDISALADYIK